MKVIDELRTDDVEGVRARVAIEAERFRWHSTRQQWDRDRARRNALIAMGWTLIHVTWDQLHHRPDEVVNTIRATLTSR